MSSPPLSSVCYAVKYHRAWRLLHRSTTVSAPAPSPLSPKVEMAGCQPGTSVLCRHRAPYHTTHTPDFALQSAPALTTPHPRGFGALSSPALAEFHSPPKPRLSHRGGRGTVPAVSHSPQHRQWKVQHLSLRTEPASP